MLYETFDLHSDAAGQTRSWGEVLDQTWSPWAFCGEPINWISATARMMMRAGLTFSRPPYGIHAVTIGNREVPVTEEVVESSPFGALLHFRKDIVIGQPKVLVVAPLSGHFATLLRATVRTMLLDHDVYITDWQNARDIPVSAGPFSFDDYVEHLIRFVRTMGEGTHILAVCQPAVQALAASAVMAVANEPAVPRSMILMAGPVDCRVNPTAVNNLAMSKPIQWFEQNLIAAVPARYEGVGRRVYPGFIQVSAFMAMNAKRHIQGHADLFSHMLKGDEGKAAEIAKFYDEYFAVLDLPAEFYLETIQTVFQEYTLARNALKFREVAVDLRAINKTALMTVEGERDDICSIGQTMAAHHLCAGISAKNRTHYCQAGAGHYGVFAGRRWEEEIYPRVRAFIESHD